MCNTSSNCHGFFQWQAINKCQQNCSTDHHLHGLSELKTFLCTVVDCMPQSFTPLYQQCHWTVDDWKHIAWFRSNCIRWVYVYRYGDNLMAFFFWLFSAYWALPNSQSQIVNKKDLQSGFFFNEPSPPPNWLIGLKNILTMWSLKFHLWKLFFLNLMRNYIKTSPNKRHCMPQFNLIINCSQLWMCVCHL